MRTDSSTFAERLGNCLQKYSRSHRSSSLIAGMDWCRFVKEVAIALGVAAGMVAVFEVGRVAEAVAGTLAMAAVAVDIVEVLWELQEAA